MADNSIYETIAKRTGGNIYIGVVGPVRTGKSTLIQRFMYESIIPSIEDIHDRERATDELPQSAGGRTITTTEPKFIPGEAVNVKFNDTALSARMIDCVGYMVNGALGDTEDGGDRMVSTPWNDSPIPFSMAGEIGTEKVVREHSTIALLVTTDGSICDISRESYVPAEEKTVAALREAGKPFAIVLNSAAPESEYAHKLATELEEKYSAPVALVNCTKLNYEDIHGILSLITGEFPIRELKFTLPAWYDLLPENDKTRADVLEKIHSFSNQVSKFSDVKNASNTRDDIILTSFDVGEGVAIIDIPVSKEHFYSVLSEKIGETIDSDKRLFEILISYTEAKNEYDKIKSALCDARERGYGIVMPSEADMRISEPRIIKQGSGYGIKVSASADTIHMIRADIKADVCPVIGSEEQTEEVIRIMREDFEENPDGLLKTKILGRTLYDLVNDGMNSKLMHMPEESREKLGQALERIINEGSNGLICILV